MDEERIGSIGGALVVATVLALGAIVAAEAFGFALFGHAEDAEIIASIAAEADERRALPPMDIPLRYDATLTQMGPDGVTRTRYYTRMENR